MNLRGFIPLIIFAVIGLFLAIGLTLNPRELPSALIDKPAPAFELPTLFAFQKKISSDYFKEKVTIFNVWASWCSACRIEHPLLMELAKSGRVNLVGLNYKDQRKDAMAWIKRFGNPYEVIAYDYAGRVGIDYGVYGVPETFVIDPQGMIRYKYNGPLTEDILYRQIIPLVEKLRTLKRFDAAENANG